MSRHESPAAFFAGVAVVTAFVTVVLVVAYVLTGRPALLVVAIVDLVVAGLAAAVAVSTDVGSDDA